MDALKQRRIWFSQSQQGDREAFLALTHEYFHWVSEFLTCSGVESVSGIVNRTQRFFAFLWGDLGHISRLRHLEQWMARRLLEESAEKKGRRPSSRHLLGRLALLAPIERLIVVSVEMEGWDLPRVARMTGLSESGLKERLLQVRCDLIGRHYIGMERGEQRFFCDQSARLGSHGFPRDRFHPRTRICFREFKSLWLECRSELIDLRQDMRFSPEEAVEVTAGIRELIALSTPLVPKTADRLRRWLPGRFFNRLESC